MREKTIVITDASDGIGAVTERRLSGNRQKVIIGHSSADTESVAREIGADLFAADFLKLSEVHVLAEQLLEKYAHIDALANNAVGVFGNDCYQMNEPLVF